MKVVALVITYEPNHAEFMKHLDRNLTALSHIIIVDNSHTTGAISFLHSLQQDNVTIIQNRRNLGVAEAQNIGIRKFHELEGEFLLQLDQDSSIPYSSLRRLFEYYLLNASIYNLAGVGPSDSKAAPRQVRELKSSGLLLPASVLHKVGRLQADLFIDLVDYEWCWRAKTNNYSFHQVPCDFYHQLGVDYKVFGIITLSIPSPIRHYYQVRNSLRLIFSLKAPFIWSLQRLAIIFLKLLLYPVILPNGRQRLRYMLLGITHCVLGKTGEYR